MRTADISELKGATITKVTGAHYGSEELRFFLKDGRVYEMTHKQECCESVALEDVVGDVSDLIGTPILDAQCKVATSQSPEDALRRRIVLLSMGVVPCDDAESKLWTFYELRTIKGTVTFRWYGSSSGAYSVDVTFRCIGYPG